MTPAEDSLARHLDFDFWSVSDRGRNSTVNGFQNFLKGNSEVFHGFLRTPRLS
jgi:hypothetical protein